MNLTKNKDFYASIIYLAIGLGLVLINLVWFLPTTRELRKNITGLEMGAAMQAHVAIEAFLEEKEEDLEVTSRFIDRYNLKNPANEIAVANILKDSYFNSAFLLNKQGQEIFRADRFKTVFPSELRDLSGTDEFKSVMNSGEVFFGKIRFSEKLEPMMLITFPVALGEGETVGVLGAELNIKELFNKISDIRIGERGQVYVVDAKGILISHRDTSLVLKKTDYSSRKIISDIISSGEHELSADDDTYVYINENEEKVLAVAHRVERAGWVAVFEEPRSEALKPIRNIQIFAGLVVLAGFVVLLILRGINSKLRLVLEDSKEKRDRLNAIISSMGEGLLVIDKDYKTILMNPVAEKLFETKMDYILGQDIRSIWKVFKGEAEIPEEERPIAKTLKTGELVYIGLEDDFYYRFPSGKKLPVEIITAPLRGDGITGVVVVFQDITKLKALDEAKTSFISLASHQLRTPLTSIRWYAEMLDSEDAGPLNKDQKDFVGRVYGGALKLNEVINLLLSLARVEAGKSGQELTKINLASFSQDILKELEPQINQKKLKTSLLLPEKELPEVQLDASTLRQVITNLLSNSIRYTNDKGRIEIQIAERKGEKEGNEIIYSVKDDGIGIPKSQQEKIFTKFFRAENAVSKVPDGSGLGLSLVKALVEIWKGKIWFESPATWGNEKKGTVFYFTIPV